MGHCVGGYCDDVYEGRSRIYSLRDAKGEPHVTIEVQPNPKPYPVSGEEFSRLSPAEKAQYREHVMQWRRRNPDVQELTDEHTAQAWREAGVLPQPDRIIQIKGINMDAEFRPLMLYVTNTDKPGFIGRLGTLLGNAGINIASFAFGRVSDGGDAIGLVAVDTPVPDSVLGEIRNMPNVHQAKRLAF